MISACLSSYAYNSKISLVCYEPVEVLLNRICCVNKPPGGKVMRDLLVIGFKVEAIRRLLLVWIECLDDALAIETNAVNILSTINLLIYIIIINLAHSFFKS